MDNNKVREEELQLGMETNEDGGDYTYLDSARKTISTILERKQKLMKDNPLLSLAANDIDEISQYLPYMVVQNAMIMEFLKQIIDLLLSVRIEMSDFEDEEEETGESQDEE